LFSQVLLELWSESEPQNAFKGVANIAVDGESRIIVSEETINNFKVAELKEHLKKRGLPVGGVKKDLQERLIDAIGQGDSYDGDRQVKRKKKK